jgi:hypothetical protein
MSFHNRQARKLEFRIAGSGASHMQQTYQFALESVGQSDLNAFFRYLNDHLSDNGTRAGQRVIFEPVYLLRLGPHR